jgi:hypothetical protein
MIRPPGEQWNDVVVADPHLVADVMRSAGCWWAVAGGWAIDPLSVNLMRQFQLLFR